MSWQVSRALDEGSIRLIGLRLYTRNLTDPIDAIVRRHRWKIVSLLTPGAIIADRTALLNQPAEDGSIFVVAKRVVDADLPGLRLRPRFGPRALSSDQPFLHGLLMSSQARALLDNIAPSRHRGSVARTFSTPELEDWLIHLITSYDDGETRVNRLRDQARELAPRLEREAELQKLDRLIGGLLNTRKIPPASGRAKQWAGG